MIYSDRDIVITKEFIKVKDFYLEAIPINTVTKAFVKSEINGSYRPGAILFFLLGILSIWFLIGFLFIAMGIAAWFTNTYKHSLMIERADATWYVLEGKKKSYLSSLATTINGLVFTKSL